MKYVPRPLHSITTGPKGHYAETVTYLCIGVCIRARLPRCASRARFFSIFVYCLPLYFGPYSYLAVAQVPVPLGPPGTPRRLSLDVSRLIDGLVSYYIVACRTREQLRLVLSVVSLPCATGMLYFAVPSYIYSVVSLPCATASPPPSRGIPVAPRRSDAYPDSVGLCIQVPVSQYTTPACVQGS